MIRKVFVLFSLMMAMAAFSCEADAQQMTDDDVMKYVTESMASGKSQKAIARELAKKGISAEQYERLKNQYSMDSADASSRNALGAADRRRQLDFSLMEVDFKAALDSLDALDSDVKQVFGRNIFNNKQLTFSPNINVPTPENYRLGSGDEVIIDIWGTNETTIRQTISPDGFINIPNIGIVSLSGLTIKEADDYLRKKVSKIYPVTGDEAGSDIKLTLGNIKTIQVHVIGEVVSPGSFFVSSLSSIYNALYLAGGVSDVGSLREISLVRNNDVIVTIDLYEFIMKGSSVEGVLLQDGDVITVPSYKNMVDIAGKVKRPMCYEMKAGESVETVIGYAGGFTGDAYKANLRLVRKDGVEYQLFTVDSLDFSDFMLCDGDSLTVEPIVDRYKNKVDIQGAVYRPGAYQLSDRISTLSQLIRKAEGLKGDAFTNRALLYREREDLTREVISVNLKSLLDGSVEDISLQRNDSLHVSSIHDIKDFGTITIEGEVTSPGVFPFVDNMTVEDIIIEAGGLLESASTVKIDVSRRIKNSASMEQPDSVGQIFTLTMKDGYAVDGSKDFVLQPYDKVIVRRSPGYFEQTSITVQGEVLFPGSYVLTHKSERLSDLVKKAGGVSRWAYLKGARLERKMNDDELKRAKSTLDFLDSAKDSIDTDKLIMTNTYYVGIDLSAALENPGTDADLVLREGDLLHVPEYVNVVKISGNVMYPNTVTYNNNFKVKDYVEMAGGYGYHSKKSRAYIIYMNGTVKKARKLSRKVVEPGCEIVVPLKRKKEGNLAEFLSVATASSSLATMIAATGGLITSLVK